MYSLPNSRTIDCVFKYNDLRMLLLLDQTIFAEWLRKAIHCQMPEQILWSSL